MKYKHLFGPVMSRRLGVSLGVDLVPYKYCSLNCVYCEVQKTTNLTLNRQEFFSAEEIMGELDTFLSSKPHLDYITFSGAGEPTLYSGFGQIARYIKTKYPAYKLALLTNGTLFNHPEVRKEAMVCDLVLPSLDAVTQSVFAQVTRPHAELKAEEIIYGLTQFRHEYKGKIWLEVFLIPEINDTETELTALRDAIQKINPDVVQLNSLDRPGAEAWVKPLTLVALKKVRKFFSATLPMPVEVIAKVKYDTQGSRLDEEVINLLHNTLKRRPSTAEDLSVMLDIHINEIGKVLRQLHLEGRVQVKRESRGVFYSWKE
jgi:wyosine [tRNA(Phe)-imidazoG37] synthetase (radical SAM superfamily)